MKVTHLIFPLSLLSAAAAPAALTIGDIISVNFAGDGKGSTPTGAAVIGAVGNTWNDIRGTGDISTSPFALNKVDSTASGVSVSIGGATFNGSISDSSNLDIFESDIYIDQNGQWSSHTSSTITLTGLGAGTMIDLYVYSAAGHTTGQGGQFTFGATTKTTSAGNDIETSYIENVNYVKFATLVADGSGTISGTWADTADQGSVLNGLQIQVVPEPSAALIGGLGLLALLRRRR